MTARKLLPQRRAHYGFSFEHDGLRYDAGVGFFPGGALAELFLTCAKPGSAAATVARDGAVAISIALQHGVPLSTLRHAMTRLPDGSAAGAVCRALDLVEGMQIGVSI